VSYRHLIKGFRTKLGRRPGRPAGGRRDLEYRDFHRVFTGYCDTEFFGLPVCFFAYRLLTGFVHNDLKFTGYSPGLFASRVILPVTYWFVCNCQRTYRIFTGLLHCQPSVRNPVFSSVSREQVYPCHISLNHLFCLQVNFLIFFAFR
jgi:hypothetical protein